MYIHFCFLSKTTLVQLSIIMISIRGVLIRSVNPRLGPPKVTKKRNLPIKRHQYWNIEKFKESNPRLDQTQILTINTRYIWSSGVFNTPVSNISLCTNASAVAYDNPWSAAESFVVRQRSAQQIGLIYFIVSVRTWTLWRTAYHTSSCVCWLRPRASTTNLAS